MKFLLSQLILIGLFVGFVFSKPIFANEGFETTTQPKKHFIKKANPRGLVMRIQKDFDGNGMKDIAFTDSASQGESGGLWYIYLSTEIGPYQVAKKPIRFHGAAIHFHGSGLLTIYLREAPLRGKLVQYQFKDGDFEEVDRKPFSFGRQSDKEKYLKLFKGLISNPIYQGCILKEFKKNSCRWK